MVTRGWRHLGSGDEGHGGLMGGHTVTWGQRDPGAQRDEDTEGHRGWRHGGTEGWGVVGTWRGLGGIQSRGWRGRGHEGMRGQGGDTRRDTEGTRDPPLPQSPHLAAPPQQPPERGRGRGVRERVRVGIGIGRAQLEGEIPHRVPGEEPHRGAGPGLRGGPGAGAGAGPEEAAAAPGGRIR